MSTLPSDSGSSLVKEGTPDEMDADDETINVVDEAIAAIKEYKDRVPEEDYSPPEVDLHRESTVPLSVWFDFESPVRDPVDIKGSQMNPKHLTKGTVSSTDSEEIRSPSPKPGTHFVYPHPRATVFRENTHEPINVVNVLNPDKDIVQNALDETLNLDNVSCQSPNEELDLDNQGWDTLMNTMSKYLFCVGSQKIYVWDHKRIKEKVLFFPCDFR